MGALEKMQKRQEQIDAFRQKLMDEGKTAAEYAKENSLNENVLYQVMSGVIKGKRGEGNRVARAIGITVF